MRFNECKEWLEKNAKLKIGVEKNEFQILPKNKKIDKKTAIMWGTYRSLINNAVTGVSAGHEKVL